MLKTCPALIVDISERIYCFNEVFLMALTSTEQLFIERLLHRRFLHNDYLPSQQTFVLIKTSFVFVFRRRLDQDEYICLSLTSSRRLQDILVKTNIFVLVIRLQDVFKTSSRHLRDVLPRRLQDIFKTSCKDIFKTFSRRIIKLNCFC